MKCNSQINFRADSGGFLMHSINPYFQIEKHLKKLFRYILTFFDKEYTVYKTKVTFGKIILVYREA